jgi:hypothetical protein
MATYVGIGIAWIALSACVALAVGKAAGRAEEAADRDFAELDRAPGQTPARSVVHEASRRSDEFARAACTAVRARSSWVYASPTSHAALALAGCCGPDAPDGADGAPLRVAGMAVNRTLPVVVAAGEATLLGVPVAFEDGRVGAIVVTGGARLAHRADAAEHLRRVAQRFAAHERARSAQVRDRGRVRAL